MSKEIYVGLHYYCKYGRNYAVYVYDHISPDGKNSTASFVSEHLTQEDARRETYRLNGWGKPKTTLTNKSLTRLRNKIAATTIHNKNI